MPERRMFSRTIVASGRFLRMPPTCRLLYYDLGMNADDDGIVEAYSVIKTTGATEDDLRVLISKGYLIVLNEDMVSYIKDWKVSNNIRADRYHPSIYKDLLEQAQPSDVFITASSPASRNQGATKPQPSDNQTATEVRLGKDSKVKDSVTNTSTRGSRFDEWWECYPKKVGKAAAQKAFCNVSVDAQVLIDAVDKQKHSVQWAKDNGKYIPNPATWLSQGRWEDEVTIITESHRTESRANKVDMDRMQKVFTQISSNNNVTEQRDIRSTA